MAFSLPQMRVRTKYGSKMVDLPDVMSGHFMQRVGPGQPNRKMDVQLLQMLLNGLAALPHKSLASERLKVDGAFGPMTLRSLKAYQQVRFGESDGVVSPGRPTIRALAQDSKLAMSLSSMRRGTLPIRDVPNPTDQIPLLPDPMVASSGEEMRANSAFHLLLRMSSVAQNAMRIVARARDLLRTKKDTDDNRRSLALLAKHFTHRDEKAEPLNVYVDFIYNIYNRSAVNLISRMNSALMRGFFEGDNHPAESNWAASTIKGSIWSPPLGAVPIGGWIKLYPRFDDGSDYLKISTIIHELSHGLGPTYDQANGVGDASYPHEPKYRDLRMGARVYTAACYGCFAHDAAFGSPSLVSDYGHVEKFERSPFVSNAGTITEP